jgi:CheY-like chemotaxis protein
VHASYGETLSILVVEDDVAVAELIRTVLNDNGRSSKQPVTRS